MADLRYDPINDLWAVVAEVRTERPNEYWPRAEMVPLTRCPFCRGHESETPQPFAEWSWDHKLKALCPAAPSEWLVRAIPNRFPAFVPTEFTEPTSTPQPDEVGICGAVVSPYHHSRCSQSCQELVIESARHIESYSQLNPDELLASFFAYRQRLLSFRHRKQLQYATLFKNCRPEAGASLAHIHSQLFGLDFVPSTVAARARRLGLVGTCPDQMLLKQLAEFEIGQRLRVVVQGLHWTVFCPFASRFAFQTWIVPRNDWGPYWDQSDPAIAELAKLVQTWTKAIEQVIERPAYNVIFHNPPLQSGGLVGHCYVELFARIGNVAGFEWASNCWINTQSPEAAADLLRERFSQCDWSP